MPGPPPGAQLTLSHLLPSRPSTEPPSPPRPPPSSPAPFPLPFEGGGGSARGVVLYSHRTRHSSTESIIPFETQLSKHSSYVSNGAAIALVLASVARNSPLTARSEIPPVFLFIQAFTVRSHIICEGSIEAFGGLQVNKPFG